MPAAALLCRLSAAGLVAAGLVLAVGLVAVTQLGNHLVVISGRSMEPAIPLGSLAVAEPFGGDEPDVGEVVTFAADNGRLLTHRVVRLVTVDGAWYVATKGDANADVDPALVPRARLVGLVTATVPGLGYVVVAMTRPQGWAGYLGLVAFLWLAGALLREVAAPSARPHPIARYAPSGYRW